MDDEIEKIKAKQLIDDAYQKNIMMMNLYKALQINIDTLIVSNEEILDLIKFFEEKEEYEICNKLKNKIKINGSKKERTKIIRTSPI